MTKLLEKALAAISKLPEPDQDAIATLILDEISDEQRWHESFARSHSELASLTDKARDDVRAGRFREAGLDEL